MTAPPAGVETGQVEFPAGTIRYHRAGDSGPAVVLLHGGGLDNGLLAWSRTVPPLAVDHRVYLPDLPGQGGSRPWRGRANQRTLEESLRWLLDEWGLRDAVLVGRSIGGSMAAGFALRHPHRVRGLVLVGSAGLQPRLNRHLVSYLFTRLSFLGSLGGRVLGASRGLVQQLLTRFVFADPADVTGEIVDQVRAEVRSRGTVLADWYVDSVQRQGMKVNHLPHLGAIRCPLMVIHGGRDELLPESVSREAAGAVAGSKLRTVPGAGHWPHLEKPNEFNALLREFLNANR